ncbi:hypothetical protein K2173_011766 [Erythroxylum novogranatense]|uniref:Uncharacterized protein n=1 Tax=Erythroxylum novogranatense TaxID=1862640 RepID=A0AAV8TTD5_9ROSI|nr:hypothetical protein K2173_011766 [Erythroxylum novogranatense]
MQGTFYNRNIRRAVVYFLLLRFHFVSAVVLFLSELWLLQLLLLTKLNDILCQLLWVFNSQLKFEDPAEGEPALVATFKQLHEDLTVGFCALEDETR